MRVTDSDLRVRRKNKSHLTDSFHKADHTYSKKEYEHFVRIPFLCLYRHSIVKRQHSLPPGERKQRESQPTIQYCASAKNSPQPKPASL